MYQKELREIINIALKNNDKEFLSSDELKELPERACNEASPVNTMILSPLYRKRMVRVLSERLIRRVLLDNI